MNFGPRHYVPVLKVKRGEKAALRCIAASVQERVTPLLEFVVRKPEKAATLDGHLDTAFKGLADSVGSYERCFLDARELADDDVDAAAKVFARARDEGIPLTPVTGVSRVADVAAAMEHAGDGIALRVTREELERGKLGASISGFLVRHSLEPEAVDLIVDVGPVDDMVSDGIAGMSAAFLAEIPEQARWRTFTLSGCAFPAALGGVERHSYAYVDRAEWVAWRDGLHARRGDLVRLPTFSDGAIQHPQGVEDFDPRIMQASAVIRYARPESWLVIKGEGTRKVVPSSQFPGLAKQLVYGHLRSEYAGATHCTGCARISAATHNAPGLGSLEVWRRLGVIHHLTTAVEGLDALPWP